MRSLGIVLFYLFLSFIATILSRVFHVDLLHVTPLWKSAATLPAETVLGIALAGGVILVSNFLDRFSIFARLNAVIARHLPDFGLGEVIVLSMASAIGEELLFRGALLQLIGIHLSSLVFGFMHYGGKRPFLLWGIIGWIMGYLLGGLFLVTGSLLAPILAHFTVNYFDLLLLLRKYKQAPADE